MPGPIEEGDKFTVSITVRVPKAQADLQKFKEAAKKFANDWKGVVSANTVEKRSTPR
jgi:hypothetical protein